MPDLEKVIDGIERCMLVTGGVRCKDCPYFNVCCEEDMAEVPKAMLLDAFSLLKAQEPVIPKPIHASERWYACGNCDCSISKGDDTYCPRCGRKVKWDD